jgi:hypothetical protein
MNSKSCILSAGLLLLFSISAVQGQETSAGADKSRDADQAVRDKAYALLESLAAQIPTLESAENRARLGSNIAASIWDHDEKLARGLLNGVQEEIRNALQNFSQQESPDIQARTAFLKLRTDTVERMAKRDPELALAFLKATEPAQDPTARYPITDTERALEMQLAEAIAADNPELALKLGRQSLARGFSDGLFPVLRQLQRKHSSQATTLYRETIARIRDADIAKNDEAFYFAESLAVAFKPPVVDESDFRDLIGMFISTALAKGCGNKMSDDDPRAEFCDRFGSLLKVMEKIDPARASQLKQWAPDPSEETGYQSSSEAYQELNEVAREGTPDEIIALARKYPEIQGDAYWRAMMRAVQLGELDRARKIANDFSGDPESKQRMLAQIEQAQKWASLNEEKLAEIQKSLSEIPRPEERIGALFMVVFRAGAMDRKVVLKLIDQAAELADTMKPGRDRIQMQIMIAMLYCLHGSDRGLAIMDSILPELNEVVSAAARLDGYEHNYLRAGEWNMSSEGSVGEILTVLARMAGYFAWCDFDRAVRLTSKFARPEIRMMAQLKLAQGILAGRPKALPFPTSPMIDY